MYSYSAHSYYQQSKRGKKKVCFKASENSLSLPQQVALVVKHLLYHHFWEPSETQTVLNTLTIPWASHLPKQQATLLCLQYAAFQHVQTSAQKVSIYEDSRTETKMVSEK